MEASRADETCGWLEDCPCGGRGGQTDDTRHYDVLKKNGLLEWWSGECNEEREGGMRRSANEEEDTEDNEGSDSR